jgi:hypothetical protein
MGLIWGSDLGEMREAKRTKRKRGLFWFRLELRRTLSIFFKWWLNQFGFFFFGFLIS